MKAQPLIRRRVVLAPNALAEVVVCRVPEPVKPSSHALRYRLAHVVGGECFLRYDNEIGNGDHQHAHGEEAAYAFTHANQLMADF